MTQKLDKQHVEAIQDIRDAFTRNAQQIGNIVLERTYHERVIKGLQEQEEKALSDFDALQQSEAELIETMRARYGDGQINLAEGTFTPEPGLAE